MNKLLSTREKQMYFVKYENKKKIKRREIEQKICLTIAKRYKTDVMHKDD